MNTTRKIVARRKVPGASKPPFFSAISSPFPLRDLFSEEHRTHRHAHVDRPPQNSQDRADPHGTEQQKDGGVELEAERRPGKGHVPVPPGVAIFSAAMMMRSEEHT